MFRPSDICVVFHFFSCVCGVQPWCGHCKTLKPDYVEASSSAPRAFTFAAVDCTVHSDTCNGVGTSGYPTLRYFEPLVEGSDIEAKTAAVSQSPQHT